MLYRILKVLVSFGLPGNFIRKIHISGLEHIKKTKTTADCKQYIQRFIEPLNLAYFLNR